MARRPSVLETEFENVWRVLAGPPLEVEYRFHPSRGWRFDFAHPASRVAVELEGGVWSGGRHVNPFGFELDCQKYNSASALGWRVFRITARMLHEDPVGGLEPILKAIRESERR